MRAVDLIRQKRDGGVLDRAAIDSFVTGVTDGTLPDYQTSALLMAILLRGMTPEETAALTDAMVRSGVRVTYPGARRARRSTSTARAAWATRPRSCSRRSRRRAARTCR